MKLGLEGRGHRYRQEPVKEVDRVDSKKQPEYW
jgi:hypothetical protein